MADLERYKLLVATIEYADGTGSKTRPAMIITFNNEVIKVLRLTSQFDNKSEKISLSILKLSTGIKQD